MRLTRLLLQYVTPALITAFVTGLVGWLVVQSNERANSQHEAEVYQKLVSALTDPQNSLARGGAAAGLSSYINQRSYARQTFYFLIQRAREESSIPVLGALRDTLIQADPSSVNQHDARIICALTRRRLTIALIKDTQIRWAETHNPRTALNLLWHTADQEEFAAVFQAGHPQIDKLRETIVRTETMRSGPAKLGGRNPTVLESRADRDSMLAAARFLVAAAALNQASNAKQSLADEADCP